MAPYGLSKHWIEYISASYSLTQLNIRYKFGYLWIFKNMIHILICLLNHILNTNLDISDYTFYKKIKVLSGDTNILKLKIWGEGEKWRGMKLFLTTIRK